MNATTTDTVSEERAEAVQAVEREFLSMAGRIRHILSQRAECLSPGLLPGNFKVFREIAQLGPVTATVIAEQLVLDKGQISRIVADLEKRGLVARTPDPKDGRAQLLEATPEAQARFARIRDDLSERSLYHNLANWQVADIRRLGELLRALNEGADIPIEV